MVVISIIGVGVVGLLVLLALRDRRAQRHFSTGSEDVPGSLREQARSQQEGEAGRGQAAGMAYGSGIGGNEP